MTVADKINPCGMVMDVLTFPYRVQCKLFKDSDELHWIRWQRASDGAKFFPVPHEFSSRIWDPKGDIDPDVGERGRRQWIKDDYSDMAGRNFVGKLDWFLDGAP